MAKDIRFKLTTKINEIQLIALNGIDIYDILTVDWSTFPFIGNEPNYNITEGDLLRPDLLSYSFYGDTMWQNVLFLINNIGDQTELTTDTIIKVPDILTLRNFVFNTNKR